jgi:hypothetical protein
MNKTERKILTLPEMLDSQTTLSHDQFTHRQEALSLLNGTNSEIKGGFRLLGQPIGSDSFAGSFLLKACPRLCHGYFLLIQTHCRPPIYGNAMKVLCAPFRISPSHSSHPSPNYRNHRPNRCIMVIPLPYCNPGNIPIFPPHPPSLARCPLPSVTSISIPPND